MVFGPTGIVGCGIDAVSQLLTSSNPSLSLAFPTGSVDGESQLMQRSFFSLPDGHGIGVVEEWLLRLSHDSVMTWLLPGVSPTKKLITLPLVSIEILIILHCIFIWYCDSFVFQSIHCIVCVYLILHCIVCLYCFI